MRVFRTFVYCIGAVVWPSLAYCQFFDGLPAASALSGADIVPICQGGTAGVPGTCTPRRAKFSDFQGAGVSASSLPLNVLAFGAKLDGVTNDTAAWAAARAATSLGGTIVVPAGKQFVNTAPTGGPAGQVLWQYNGTTFSDGTTPVVSMGTDVVETFLPTSGKFFGRGNSVIAAGPVLRVDSTLNHTGGSGSNSINTLRVNTTPSGTFAESAIGIGSIINSTKTGGGNVVSLAAFVTKSANHAAGDFGTDFGAIDATGNASSVSGALVGGEIDAVANGADDGGVGAGLIPNNQGVRVVWDVVGAKNTPGGADVQIGWGVRVGPSFNLPGITFRRNFAAYGPFSTAAFSTEFATQNAGAHAIWLGDGHHIAFDNAGTRTVFYDSGSGKLFFAVSGVNKFSVDASGNVRAAGTITPSVTP